MGLGIVSDWRNCDKSVASVIYETIYRPKYFYYLQADCQPQQPFARLMWYVDKSMQTGSQSLQFFGCNEWRRLKRRCGVATRFAFLICAFAVHTTAQQARGELQIEVRDPQQRGTAATGDLVSESNQVKKTFSIGADGKYLVAELPFGVYRLSITAEGFAVWTGLIEVRGNVPVRVAVQLGMASLATKVEVTDAATVLDPSQTATVYSLSDDTLRENQSPQAGRTLSDLVNDQPGWLYEASGVLHPRGSEYQVQYVLDGVPLTQNRSPAFAPPLDSGDVESMRVMTAGYAAEYGRKLGGVIELTTEKNPQHGWHGRFESGAGSFDSLNGSGEIAYSSGKNHYEASGQGFHTDRFLDPPVLENHTNSGNGSGFSAAYEHDFSERDRLHAFPHRSFTNPAHLCFIPIVRAWPR